MDRERRMRVVGAALGALLVLGAGNVLARIPEPHHVIVGTVAIDGAPGVAGNVSLALSGGGSSIATYRLGSEVGTAGRYVLRVPMDSLSPQEPGTARAGDLAEVFVNGIKAAEVVIGERGTYSTLDVSVTTVHEIRFTGGPTALPGSTGSGGRVQVSVAAMDTFGHPVSYRWEGFCPGLPSGGSFESAEAASTFWTAPENATGIDTTCALKVTARDAEGVSGWRSTGVTVRTLPHAVTIVAGPTGAPNPVASGGDVALSATARDGHGHTLTYAWSADCPGMPSVGSFTGNGAAQVSWTAPVNASDIDAACTISVEVSDGFGLSARGTLTEVVLSATHRLVIAAAAVGTPNPVIAGGTVVLNVTAEDSRGHEVSYTWSASCSGGYKGSFSDAATRTPIWTAPSIPTGTHVVCVLQATAADGPGLTARSSYVQEVRGGNPVAVAAVEQGGVLCPEAVALDGAGSFHENPRRRIVFYEWDLDYDGTLFDRDMVGERAQLRYGQVDSYVVALRVTDDSDPPLQSVATAEVTVGGPGPEAVAGGPYLLAEGGDLGLDGSGSSSPGGTCGNRLATFAWDLDGDTEFDDAEGVQPRLGWDKVAALVCGGACTVGQSYPIVLKVTDLLGQEATAETVVWIDSLDSQVKLVTPNGGEMLGGGESFTLRWVSSGDVEDVRFLLRTPAWADWREVLETAAADGSTTWRIPTLPGKTLRDYQMRVVGLAGGQEVAEDASDGPFALGPLDVTYPELGAVLGSGDSVTVTWAQFATVKTAARARISYTLDGGATWRKAGEVSRPSGAFSWTVPAPVRAHERCQVRVQLLDAAGRVIGADTGEGFFTILGKVDLVTPGQGDAVYAGTTRFVRWESGRIPGVASTHLKISTDGGKSWRSLGKVPGNPGSYTWQVPPGDVTPDKCRIRVVMRNSRGAAVAAADGEGFFTVSPLPEP